MKFLLLVIWISTCPVKNHCYIEKRMKYELSTKELCEEAKQELKSWNNKLFVLCLPK